MSCLKPLVSCIWRLFNITYIHIGHGKTHNGLLGDRHEKLSHIIRMCTLKVMANMPFDLYPEDKWSEFDIEIDNPLLQEAHNVYA